jgi:hypothetical protein
MVCRGVGGSCPSDKVELLLQMIQSRFTAQPFDAAAFHRIVNKHAELLRDRWPQPHTKKTWWTITSFYSCPVTPAI